MGGFSDPKVMAVKRAQTYAKLAQPDPRAMPPIQRSPGPIKNVILPYYDTRRILDLDKIQAAKENGEERGDSESGDGGTLGPGGSPGNGIAPPMSTGVTLKKEGLTGGQLALLAAATFFLFGG